MPPPQIPNLDGQPGWVVIVVVALLVIGSTAAVYFKRKETVQAVQTDSKPDPEVLVSGTVIAATTPDTDNLTALTVVQAAMTHLADAAKRETEQSERAEEEARQLRAQLDRCKHEIDTYQRKLDECTRNYHELIRAFNARQNNV